MAVRRAPDGMCVASIRAQMVITFLGTKGGTGTTTLAVNCAADIRRLTDRATLIADLKAAPGDVAVLLGVRPRYSIVDVIDQFGWTDRTRATRFVAEHESGLQILAASESLGRPASRDTEAVDQTLRCFASLYDFLVIDAGNTLTECTSTALAISDVVLLVANPDLPCLRNLQRLGDALRIAGVAPERLKIVLNRTSDNHMLPVAQIETVLSRSIDYQVPSDYRTVASAVNAGVPVSSLRATELHVPLEAIARSLLAHPAAEREVQPAR